MKIRDFFRSHIITTILICIGLFYLVLVVFLKLPISEFYRYTKMYLIVMLILFAANIVGLIGAIVHNISKKAPMGIYELSYKIGKIPVFISTSPVIISAYSIELIRTKRYKKALEVIESGINDSFYFMVSLTLMKQKAIVYLLMKDLKKSINTYLEILLKFGKDGQILFDVDLDEDELNEVESDFKTNTNKDELNKKQIVEENPHFMASDYTTLGYAYALNKEYDEAIFYTRLAITKQDDYAAAFDNYGQIALAINDTERAKKHFTRALELDENLTDSLFCLAQIYYNEGDIEKAKEYADRINYDYISDFSTAQKDMIEEFINKLK